jgi:sugar/nucleoside kinase (ribokinase family)
MSVVCLGILVADVFLPSLPRLPEAGELLATEDFLLQAGGCAANTAVDLARLGVRASVVGRVGDDPFGTFVADELRSKGVDVARITRAHGLGTSKTVIVTVAGEDRRYIHTIGANASVRAEDLDGVVLAAGDVLYVGGYLVLPALEQEALAARLQAARAAGARTVLDVVVPSGVGAQFSQVERLLPHIDVFVPNQDEARALTGETEPYRQAGCFLDAGASAVVVTRGLEGALLAVKGRVVELPAPAVDVVESSGAGDAFAAGFICGLVEGWPLERSFAFASAVGASACTALGCTAGVFTRDLADGYVAAHSSAPDEAR